MISIDTWAATFQNVYLLNKVIFKDSSTRSNHGSPLGNGKSTRDAAKFQSVWTEPCYVPPDMDPLPSCNCWSNNFLVSTDAKWIDAVPDALWLQWLCGKTVVLPITPCGCSWVRFELKCCNSHKIAILPQYTDGRWTAYPFSFPHQTQMTGATDDLCNSHHETIQRSTKQNPSMPHHYSYHLIFTIQKNGCRF